MRIRTQEAVMPIDIRIIHTTDFLKVTGKGDFDLEESKRLLMEIASAADPLVQHELILDTRRMHSQMSIGDLYNLAAQLGSFRKTFSRKTAVLCPIDRTKQAEAFALFAGNRGFGVRAFTSFEEAIEWLLAKDDAAGAEAPSSPPVDEGLRASP
jgi:hypothetical protein